MDHVIVERAGKLFESGFYCAESVLKAIAEGKGIQSDLIPKIATGFCSGVSRTCNTCGAVSGGIMAISLFTGRENAEASVERNFSLVQDFIERFSNKFGDINCQRLIGYDLGNADENRAFDESGKLSQCREYTEEATRMAWGLIEEYLE